MEEYACESVCVIVYMQECMYENTHVTVRMHFECACYSVCVRVCMCEHVHESVHARVYVREYTCESACV